MQSVTTTTGYASLLAAQVQSTSLPYDPNALPTFNPSNTTIVVNSTGGDSSVIELLYTGSLTAIQSLSFRLEV